MRYHRRVSGVAAPSIPPTVALGGADAWLGLPVEVSVAGASLQVRVGSGAPPSGPAAAAVLRASRGACWLLADAAAVRALAQRVLGGPDEDPAPRPPTFEERATWAAVAALIVDRADLEATVEPAEQAPAGAMAWIALALELDGSPLGPAWVGVPDELAHPLPIWGGAVIATRAELVGLRVGDVVVLGDVQAEDGPVGVDEVRAQLAVGEQTLAPTGAVLARREVPLALWWDGAPRVEVAWFAGAEGPAVRVLALRLA